MPAPDQPASLAAALAELQTQLPHIGKSKTAKVTTKDKGSYSYTYADLGVISRELLPLMAKLGLSFSSKPTFLVGENTREFGLAYTSLAMAIFYMATAIWPEHNNFVDEHIVNMLVLAGLFLANAGRYYGLGKAWQRVEFVKRHPVLA